MAQKRKNISIDAGRAESEIYEPSEEVQQEFEDAQRLASGSERLTRELREHHSRTPLLSGGVLDADAFQEIERPLDALLRPLRALGHPDAGDAEHEAQARLNAFGISGSGWDHVFQQASSYAVAG